MPTMMRHEPGCRRGPAAPVCSASGRGAGRPGAWRAAAVIAVGACLALSAMIVAGCQTTAIENDGRPLPPRPRDAAPTPDDAVVHAMAFMVGAKPRDTNNNRFPDQIETRVMLFAQPYPIPKWADGEFVFTLYPSGDAEDPDAEPIAQWQRNGDAVADARIRSEVGPAYRFVLSMFEDGGSDVRPAMEADLVCTFYPANDDPPVTSSGVRSITIGRRLSD